MDIGIGTYTALKFEDAVAATRTALAERGFGIITEIDFTATLKDRAGEEIEKVMILGTCAPQFAAKAFGISKDVALLLPCNVVVRETGGGVIIEAVNPALLSQVVSGGLMDLADEMAATLREMMTALTR